MKKILYIFGGEKASGAEIVIDRLMRNNIEAVEPHLMLSPGSFADNLEKDHPYPITKLEYLKKLNRNNQNILVFILKALRNYIFVSRAALKYIAKHQITVVHANTVVPASYLLPAILVSKLFGKRTAWIWSDHDLTYFSKFDAIFGALNHKVYSVTLAVSEAVKKKYHGSEKCHVLYNGLDPEIFRPDTSSRSGFRGSHGFTASQLVFGIAGTISKRKGQLELIRAFIAISDRHKDIFLLLAGGIVDEEHDYTQEVMKLVLEHQGQIRYIGQTRDISSFYNGCDCIISNSDSTGSEPLGTTIYEAMAHEKIVVASDTGGTPEIITNNIDGFTFESGNYVKLAETLEHVILNITSLSQMKVMAREKVYHKFNINLMTRNYNQVVLVAAG